MEIFTASTTYGEFKGSVSGDSIDFTSTEKWLKEKEYIDEDQKLIGISAFMGENLVNHEFKDYFRVSFLLLPFAQEQNMPSLIENPDFSLPLKEVSKKMDFKEFFALFKRFDICLSFKGVIEGKKYHITETKDL